MIEKGCDSNMRKSLIEALRCGYGLTEDRKSGLPAGYFPHWEYNVYGNEMDDRCLSMFNRGSGGELDKKACAIHSSSMLSYNFFHWIDADHPLFLSLDGRKVEFVKVYFEVQMMTLKSRGKPANMDVLLVSKDDKVWLMLESKFTEYLSNREFDVRDSYLTEGKYLNDQGSAWVGVIQDLEQRMKRGKRYYEGIKQNICHLIGIRNLLCSNDEQKAIQFFNKVNNPLKFTLGTSIYFSNLVFKPNPTRFENEFARYNDYFRLWLEMKEVIKANGCLSGLHVDFMSYSDIWRQMCGSKKIAQDLKEFLLRRYMQFADV